MSFIFADLAQLLLEQGVVRVLSLEVFWGRDFARDLRAMFHTLDRVLQQFDRTVELACFQVVRVQLGKAEVRFVSRGVRNVERCVFGVCQVLFVLCA